GSRLVGRQTTFFSSNLGSDARYQTNSSIYSGQWAEIAYFMVPETNPSGAAIVANDPAQAGGNPTQLYALYRCQYLVMADNSTLNWPPAGGSLTAADYEVSCGVNVPGQASGLYYFSPTDLGDANAGTTSAQPNTPRKRAFQHPSFPENGGKTPPRGT